MNTNNIFIELKNIKKIFPGVVALEDVNFDVGYGEVHALVGENGAGKSTLIKILGGVYQPDAGEIIIEGKKESITNTSTAQRLKIAVIYQEFNLIPDLSVAENIFIGREPKIAKSFINWKKINNDASEIMKKLDININPRKFISELSVAEKQMIEIAKSLSMDAKLIIMDEPTATLTEKEVVKLFSIIKELKKKNVSIIYISHRLDEAFQLSDRITVLRDGKKIETKKTMETNQDEIVSLMVGKVVKNYFSEEREKPDESKVVMEIKNYNIAGTVYDMNFKLYQGEILGFAGILGSGIHHLLRSLYGATQKTSGEVYFEERKVEIRKPSDAIKLGIGYVTEDRKGEGLLNDMSVLQNISIIIIKMLTFFKGLLIREKKELEMFNDIAEELDIKYANINQRIIYLSGGNQQKIIMGRTLVSNCKVLILLEPTRGIDVGAKTEIYTLINQCVERGDAIIMISSELPELLGVADRIMVMRDGRVVDILDKENATQESVIKCALVG
ncbi:MAG TPA: D-xylose ABC transporter ATP-binding protein [Actinobacteria bacterium]|nr:D-xylose ABC transporter ATP-binding protein [Actinomycetota bacterium]